MNYGELLKRARANIPQVESKSRFEMPQASVFVGKKQTVIKNFSEMAKSMRREPKHIAKFLFK